jgi:uncharacterized protein YgbK (DUF1537 family)
VQLDTEALAGSGGGPVIANAVTAAAKLIADGGLAIVATSRRPGPHGLAQGERIASGLARVVAELRAQVDVVLSKGGITSAINLSEGLGAMEADVLGPIAPGISLWRVATPQGAGISYVVFPGNVGGEDTLSNIVDMLAPA